MTDRRYPQAIEIDPNFFLPPNVVDMRYVDLEEADSNTMRDSEGEVVGASYDEVSNAEFEAIPTGSQDSSETMLPTPDSVSLVSQEVRVTADGKIVVDVVLDVADISGAVNYEVRMTKI